jgi:hypothetical protein
MVGNAGVPNQLIKPPHPFNATSMPLKISAETTRRSKGLAAFVARKCYFYLLFTISYNITIGIQRNQCPDREMPCGDAISVD